MIGPFQKKALICIHGYEWLLDCTLYIISYCRLPVSYDWLCRYVFNETILQDCKIFFF